MAREASDSLSGNITTADQLAANANAAWGPGELSIRNTDLEMLKASIESDGKLTLNEANRWYRNGRGLPLNIDASTIDVDFLDGKNWNVGMIESRQLLMNSKSGKVYGQLTFEYMGSNNFKVFNDNYGFELHRGSLDMSISKSFKLMFRNAATNVGHTLAGNGYPYDIKFYNRIISVK